ncbi:MAG: helicase-associated domain-containing protein [Antricoccus sp.]
MSESPRTLAAWLRAQDDAWLAQLVRQRPDAAFPMPNDISTLAARLGSRVSVGRALDTLNQWDIQVLSGLVLLGSSGNSKRVAAMADGATSDQVSAAFDRLRDLALIWGEPEAMNVAAPVRDAMPRYIAGLGRSAAELFDSYRADSLRVVLGNLGLPLTRVHAVDAIASRLRDTDYIVGLLDQAPDGAARALSQLDEGTPYGELQNADRLLVASDDLPPVRWLLSHGLLAFSGPNTVELPREVGLILRGEHPLGPAIAAPLVNDVSKLQTSAADGTAATHAQESIRNIRRVVEALEQLRPRVLRAGGLGSREARKIAKLADLDVWQSNLMLHIANAAGLIAETKSYEPVWLPTDLFDQFSEQSDEVQWTRLAMAWLQMPVLSWLSDSGEAQNPHALSHETQRASASSIRTQLLSALADLVPGSAPAVDQIQAIAQWRWPRRFTPSASASIGHTLREAEALGFTGQSALSTFGRRAAASQTEQRIATAIGSALPAPIDYFLLQADLTAIAPGRLARPIAATLGQLADIESAGGATVYRLSETSVRRGLDSGLDVEGIHQFLRTHSKTPPPQALTYLVDDLGRRHGVLRAGPAAAFLRCDDVALLDGLIANAGLAAMQLHLRRIAPTVIVCTTEPDELLAALRAAGYAPTFEDQQGMVVTLSSPTSRAPIRRVSPSGTPTLDSADLEQVVSAMRGGDQIAEARASASGRLVPDAPGVTTAAVRALVDNAIRDGNTLHIDSVDSTGRYLSYVILPYSMSAGLLHARDAVTTEDLHMPLHRLRTVSVVPSP